MSEEPHVPREASDLTHPGGMRARRVFPTDRQSHLDPFVVFERFHIEPWQGFDTHPHRGFEIVSYVLEGGMAHADSMGHESTARAGDAMRITTGSGMEHSELPADGAPCSGLQLWVNLPRAEKGVAPSSQDAPADALPVDERDGATVTRVVGEGSPVELHTPVTYEDAAVRESWEWTVPDGWNGVLFVVTGSGTVDGRDLGPASYLIREDGGSASVETDAGIRVVGIGGEPHGDPIRQRGPFVN